MPDGTTIYRGVHTYAIQYMVYIVKVFTYVLLLYMYWFNASLYDSMYVSRKSLILKELVCSRLIQENHASALIAYSSKIEHTTYCSRYQRYHNILYMFCSKAGIADALYTVVGAATNPARGIQITRHWYTLAKGLLLPSMLRLDWRKPYSSFLHT